LFAALYNSFLHNSILDNPDRQVFPISNGFDLLHCKYYKLIFDISSFICDFRL